MKSLTVLSIVAAGTLPLVAGQALAASNHAANAKVVTVAMHDPGCHWFSANGKFTKTMSVKGPVALANLDEATLKVAGPSGVRRDPVGKKITLSRGTYRITMVGQAPDDNILKLVVK